MPTSTDIQNLKINTLTEAQYDAAVLGGVIGVNELSILTDAEAGQVIQVSTMPTASATENGKIYQFVGTTDANYTNGYFYKCVSDGQTPATYSWTQTDVQPQSGGLPSQTGQSGKFLTTDGTDASWSDKPLVNKAEGYQSVVINTNPNSTTTQVSGPYNVMVGFGARVNHTNAQENTIVGYGANVNGNKKQNVIIGNGAESYANCGTAIGKDARVSADYATQIGCGASPALNSDANTFKVANANGNFEIMSADGTIPKARLVNALSSTTVTIAVADWNGGTTASKTINGLTATSVVFVAPDNASQSDYLDAGVYASAQTTDTLTFTCTTTPTSSLTVTVVFC